MKIKTEVEDEYEQIVSNVTVKTEVQDDFEPVVTGQITVKSEFEYENMDFMHSDDAQFGDLTFSNFTYRQDMVDPNDVNLFNKRNEHLSSFNFTQASTNSGLVKNETEETTNESTDSIGNQNRKNPKRTVFKHDSQHSNGLIDENTNESNDSVSNQSRKSAKRTVFKRDSPYTKREALYTRRDVEDNTKKNLSKRDVPYRKQGALYTRREARPSQANSGRVEAPFSSQPQVNSGRVEFPSSSQPQRSK